jgi:hypothetical protein
MSRWDRGSAIITRIHILGFESVLNVSHGKKIQHWKRGFRDLIQKESSRLRSLAISSVTPDPLFPSQEIDESNEPEVSPNPLSITWPPSLENCPGYLSSLEKQEGQENGEIQVSDVCVAVKAFEVK